MPIPALAAPAIGIGRSILGSFFGGSHRKAVANEQSTNTAAQNTADSALQQVEVEVGAGMLKGEAIGARLDAIERQFGEDVAPVLKETGGKCNAACVYKKQMHDRIALLKTKYKVVAQAVENQRAKVGNRVLDFFKTTPGRIVLFVVPGAGIAALLFLALRARHK